jgi:hypothetical protein
MIAASTHPHLRAVSSVQISPSALWAWASHSVPRAPELSPPTTRPCPPAARSAAGAPLCSACSLATGTQRDCRASTCARTWPSFLGSLQPRAGTTMRCHAWRSDCSLRWPVGCLPATLAPGAPKPRRLVPSPPSWTPACMHKAVFFPNACAAALLAFRIRPSAQAINDINSGGRHQLIVSSLLSSGCDPSMCPHTPQDRRCCRCTMWSSSSSSSSNADSTLQHETGSRNWPGPGCSRRCLAATSFCAST